MYGMTFEKSLKLDGFRGMTFEKSLKMFGSEKMIAPDLRTRVVAMRDEFAHILDTNCVELDGELRVKLAKAELLLNKIGKLLAGEHSDTGGIDT